MGGGVGAEENNTNTNGEPIKSKSRLHWLRWRRNAAAAAE